MQPSESGKIPVKLTTSKAGGVMTKTVTVRTNVEGAGSTITLKIKGEVWQPVQVVPQTASFGRITSEQANEGMTRKLTIVNNIEGQMKLENLISSNPAFKVDLTPIEEGKKYEMTVTLAPPLQTGSNNGKITLTTGLDETPQLEVTAFAVVTSPVDVTPTELAVQPERAADMTRQLYVRSNDGKAVKISDLTASNPDLKVRAQDMKAGTTYRIAIEIPASYKPSAQGDTITFKTDHPAVPMITVPIKEQTVIRSANRPATAGVGAAAARSARSVSTSTSPLERQDAVRRAQAASLGVAKNTSATDDGAKTDPAATKARPDVKPKEVPAEN